MKKILLTLTVFFSMFAAMADEYIVSHSVSLPERTAAQRLAFYLKQMLKTNVNISKEAKSPAIYVGKNAQTAKMLGMKDFSSLKYEEIIIKSVGKDLVILGEGKRGTLYAVYTYLEDFLGFRFWAWREYDIPPAKNFRMSGINYRYNPLFTKRSMYQWPLPHLPAQWKTGDAEFAVICRNNTGLTHTTAEYGGGDYSAGFVHTFNRIMPPGKYFKSHPEFYSLIKGKRNPQSQLCLSNKEMRKAFIEEAKKYYKKANATLAITISHNDNGLFCECAPCKALLEREKGRMAGVEIDFVNEIAIELEKVYPGIIVETLAYGPTIKPALVTMPRKNVIIRHADLSINPAYPINHEVNKHIAENFLAWAKIANQMAMWYYVDNAKNPIMPHPVIEAYAENIKFFRDNKVTNVFLEDNATTMGLTHLNSLRTYIARRMFWDPYLDFNKLLVEFTDGYYGKKAGAVIRDYIRQIHAPLKEKIPGTEILRRIKEGYFTESYIRNRPAHKQIKKNPNGMYYPIVAVYYDHALAYMSRENMIKCWKLIEKAIEVAENDKFKERARDAAFSIRTSLLTDHAIAADPQKYGFTAQQLKNLLKVTFADAKRIGNRRMGLQNSGISVIENQAARIHEINKKIVPDFLKGVNSKELEFFNYKDWSLMVPKRAIIIDDPDSYDGKVYSMKNTPPSWALQCRNITTSVRPGKYKVYLRIRMIPKKGRKNIKPGVFFTGAYYRRDKGYDKKTMIRAKTEDFIDGKYHWQSAGIADVDTSVAAYFFADPCNHPDVEAIVIDQLLLQRVTD